MLGQQYSLITAENECKWAATEPQYNVFDYSQCDTIYKFCHVYLFIFLTSITNFLTHKLFIIIIIH
jgi:hypothetical protein